MAINVARLQAVLSADTKQFEAAMLRSEQRMKGLSKAALATAGVAGLGAIALTLRAGFREWQQEQTAAAQTTAVIKSTGGVAHVTAGHVEELSKALLKKTGIDDETVQAGANMLLTFRGIRNEVGKGNDIFDQATKAGLDMSVALKGAGFEGGNLKTTMIRLGKALNDPVRGITALRRVGVQFTDAQTEMIKKLVNGAVSIKAANTDLKNATTALAAARLADARSSEAVRSAQEALVQANRGVRDSLEAVTYATRNVTNAKYSLVEAQKTAKAAQQALTQARKDAVQQLIDLKFALRGALLSEESATIAVQRAQEHLSEVMADGKATDLDKRDAVLGLEQAELALQEAQRTRKKATDDVNKSSKDGVKGNREVLNAQESLKQAQHGLAQALLAVQDAQNGVRDAQESVRDAQVAAAKAGRDLADAQAAQALNSQKLADAQNNLAKAQMEVAKAGKNQHGVMLAQKLILKEVNAEFGGSAAALGKNAARADE